VKNHAVIKTVLCVCVVFLALEQNALAASTITIGNMASMITASFASLAKLITAGSYLAGIGFAIGAILKFKQHKDNPTQITIGQPIALTFIAASLLFLPSILAMTGSTMFGAGQAVMAGPTGIDLTQQK
jgi:intracellular multiplication protein IcmD